MFGAGPPPPSRRIAATAAAQALGPLRGVPLGIKDVLVAAEAPAAAQSVVLDPVWRAGRDVIAVERLKAAGAIVTGKLTTTEYAPSASWLRYSPVST